MNRRSISFEITVRTHEELMEKYDIEINEDGTIFDPCDCIKYDNLRQWAAEMDRINEEEENRTTHARMGGKHDYWEE